MVFIARTSCFHGAEAHKATAHSGQIVSRFFSGMSYHASQTRAVDGQASALPEEESHHLMFRRSPADSPSLQAGVMWFCSGESLTVFSFGGEKKKRAKTRRLSLGDDKGTLGLQMFGADDRWRRRSPGSDGSGVSARRLPPPRAPARVFFISPAWCASSSPPTPSHSGVANSGMADCAEGRREDASERTCKTHGDSVPLRPQPGAPTRVPRPPQRPRPLGPRSRRRVGPAAARSRDCLKEGFAVEV